MVTGLSYLRPSLHWEETIPGWNALGSDEVWVNLKTGADYGSLIDTGENSGLVTATENTTVKPGDRVVIAVNFNTWGGFARPDMIIGPRVDVEYKEHRYDRELGSTDRTLKWHTRPHTLCEGPWCLNPNLQLREGYRLANRETAIDWLYGTPEGTLPSSTAVKVWNASAVIDADELGWGALGTGGKSPGWPSH